MADDARVASARAFLRSFNILLKSARMYGFEHQRTIAQFEGALKDLRGAFPPDGVTGLTLGVSGKQLLVNAVPIESTPAEKSFGEMLAAGGIASLLFSPLISGEDFDRFVRTFVASGTKNPALGEQLRASLATTAQPTIRVNEIRYVAEDGSSAESKGVTPMMAGVFGAGGFANALGGGEMQSLLTDPRRLLQMIVAAEGAETGGGSGGSEGGGGSAEQGGFGYGSGPGGRSEEPSGSAYSTDLGGDLTRDFIATPEGASPSAGGEFEFSADSSGATGVGGAGGGGGGSARGPAGGPGSGAGTGTGSGFGGGSGGGGGTGGGFGAGPGAGSGFGPGRGPGGGPGGGVGRVSGFSVDEADVFNVLRLLSKVGKASAQPNSPAEAQQVRQEISTMGAGTQRTLQQALASLPAVLPSQRLDTPMLLQLAEHMAIQHALDRFARGETRVNAVQEMFAKMGKELDGLRKVLGAHEDKMRKAGMRVETYAETLDRQFWASLPEAGKRTVLLSPDCWCIPPRNVRSFIDQTLERGDAAQVNDVLRNYAAGLCNPEGEARSKTAAGMMELVDLYGRADPDVLSDAVSQAGTALEQALRESVLELARELGETFTRLAQEATTQKNFGALRDALEVLSTIEKGGGGQRDFAKSLRSRMGLEKQLSEFVDNAIRAPRLPDGLLEIVRRQPHQTAEQLAGRVIRCGRKRERERLVEIAKDIGEEAGGFLRKTLESRPAADAVTAIGLLCRLDPEALEEILPRRLAEWNRFYHDMAVRQLACCGAPERARLLLKFSEFLDPLVLPCALDEVAMCGDLSVVPTLLQLAAGELPRLTSPYLRVKAIEALSRLHPPEAAPFLRKLLEARQAWRWTHPREMRIVAAQAMQKIDPGWLQPFLAGADLPAAELAMKPFDPMDDAPGVRQRTYQRIKLPKEIEALVITTRGEYMIEIAEMSLGGGYGQGEGTMALPPGSEARLEMQTGWRGLRAQVLVRDARSHKFCYEVVDIDLEDRLKLRRLLIEAHARSS
jgi:hypothetical protein